MRQLTIKLLGVPLIDWQDEALSVPRRQCRALLFYLAECGQPTTRGVLCDFLWPEQDESQTRRNLSHLLTHLRSALPDAGILCTDYERVWLRPDAVQTDIDAFEAAYRCGCGKKSLAELAEAADLYRGPFLDGFYLDANGTYETWITQQQHRFEGMYLSMLQALIEAYTVRGAYQTAIEYAERLLKIDNLVEEVHRLLIELHAARGDRRAAVRHFQQWVKVLEQELGTAPSPQTKAVIARIRASDNEETAVACSPDWKHELRLEAPLVARDAAWDLLEKGFAQTLAGHGQVCLVHGESGSGKTRLMHDFALGKRAEALVLHGGACSCSQAMPFYPLVEALRPLAQGACARKWQYLPRARLGAAQAGLSDLLESLLTAQAGVGQVPLFEATTEWFEDNACNGRAPTILCLDDLHLAEPPLLRWLAYLRWRLPGMKLLVLGSYCCAPHGELRYLLHLLRLSHVLTEIELGGLDETAVAEILSHLALPPNQLPGLAGRLCAATGGNPFFLLETLRLSQESSQGNDWGASAPLPIAATIAEVVQARIDHLSPNALKLLEAVSVLPSSCCFSRTRLTAGCREIEALNALEELEQRCFIVIHEASRIQLQHELVRQIVCDQMSDLRRQVLTRRAAKSRRRLRRVASL